LSLEGLFYFVYLDGGISLAGSSKKAKPIAVKKEALLCYKKVVLTSVVAKESDNG
jgi:hypothetical protein